MTDGRTDERTDRQNSYQYLYLLHSFTLLRSFTPGSKPTFSTNPFHRRFLLPTGLPHDNGTGPDLSCSSFYYPPFASIAKGEVFGLLYVCLFVCSSTISRQPAGRFTPKFACRRPLVPDVSSPLLGVGGPRRAEKKANEIFVTMGVNGEFLHFGGF